MTRGVRTPPSRSIGFGLLLLIAAGLIVALFTGGDTDIYFTAVAFAIYATLGGLIVFRRDGHLAGWLLTAIGLMVMFGAGFADISWVPETSGAWVNSWVWSGVFAFFVVLVVTFPAGTLPRGPGIAPRLWRVALGSLPVLVATGALTNHLSGPESAVAIDNPVGLLPDWMGSAALLAIVVIFIASIASLVVRRRRVQGQERAQFTWVVFAATLLVAAIVLAFAWVLGSIAIGRGDPGDEPWGPAFVMMLLFPTSFAVAILRYRLFEIDRIISRTVTYAVMIGVLAAVYVGSITFVSTLLSAESDLAVASSTLAVALLFNPLLRRVRVTVDRRFNRAGYDAQRLGEQFASTLQVRADPRAVVDTWVGVVAEAIGPRTIGVWIRPGRSAPATAPTTPRP